MSTVNSEALVRRCRDAGALLRRAHLMLLVSDSVHGTMGGDARFPRQEHSRGGDGLLYFTAVFVVEGFHRSVSLRILPSFRCYGVRNLLQGLDGGFWGFVSGMSNVAHVTGTLCAWSRGTVLRSSYLALIQ